MNRLGAPGNGFGHVLKGFGPMFFNIEFLYTIIVVVACLIIFFKTKEMYELSGHKGIKFFRHTFLWLGIAYFVRFLLILFNVTTTIFHANRGIMEVGLFIFVYASTMALLAMSYSIVVKKKSFNEEFAFSLIAMIIALLVTAFKNPGIFILVQLYLFVYAGVVGFTKRHKLKGTYIVYMVLFLFWIINQFALALPMYFILLKTYLYILSMLIFGLILYLVLKRIKNGKKR